MMSFAWVVVSVTCFAADELNRVGPTEPSSASVTAAPPPQASPRTGTVKLQAPARRASHVAGNCERSGISVQLNVKVNVAAAVPPLDTA